MSKDCEVDRILKECLSIHAQRDEAYGGDVFENTAKITAIIIGRHFSAFEAAACLAAHKIARYSYQICRLGEEGKADTLRDIINYFALMERERIKQHVNKERTITTPKGAPKSGVGSAGHTDLSGIKPYVPQSSTEKSTGCKGTSVYQVPKPE